MDHWQVRVATTEDIPKILELWGNLANLRQFHDSCRWNWASRASQVWQQYASEALSQSDRFLVVGDSGDQGLASFLFASLVRLPSHFEADRMILVEDLYLRPKDRQQELLAQMLKVLTQEARHRYGLPQSRGLPVQIEAIEPDQQMSALLRSVGLRPSSVTYSGQL